MIPDKLDLYLSPDGHNRAAAYSLLYQKNHLSFWANNPHPLSFKFNKKNTFVNLVCFFRFIRNNCYFVPPAGIEPAF